MRDLISSGRFLIGGGMGLGLIVRGGRVNEGNKNSLDFRSPGVGNSFHLQDQMQPQKTALFASVVFTWWHQFLASQIKVSKFTSTVRGPSYRSENIYKKVNWEVMLGCCIDFKWYSLKGALVQMEFHFKYIIVGKKTELTLLWLHKLEICWCT